MKKITKITKGGFNKILFLSEMSWENVLFLHVIHMCIHMCVCVCVCVCVSPVEWQVELCSLGDGLCISERACHAAEDLVMNLNHLVDGLRRYIFSEDRNKGKMGKFSDHTHIYISVISLNKWAHHNIRIGSRNFIMQLCSVQTFRQIIHDSLSQKISSYAVSLIYLCAALNNSLISEVFILLNFPICKNSQLIRGFGILGRVSCHCWEWESKNKDILKGHCK